MTMLILFKEVCWGKIYAQVHIQTNLQLGLPGNDHLRAFPKQLCQLSLEHILPCCEWEEESAALEPVRFSLLIFFSCLTFSLIKDGIFPPICMLTLRDPLPGRVLMLLFQSQVSRAPVHVVLWKCLSVLIS